LLVTLPRGQPERLTPVAELEASPAATLHAGRRALVVDDENLLVKLQVSFLSQLGIEATGVFSGENAIRYMEEHDVDMVISDVRMPGPVDGLGLREWIRANRPALLGRFLLVSGDVAGFDSGEFSGSTPDLVLQKPFRFDEYARVIRQALASGTPS
jgi:CheY-like chemotaxis protein